MEAVCLYEILPVEMIEEIIKNVRHTKTLLSLRKVDRFFYSKLKSFVPIYEYNNDKIGYFKFMNDRFAMIINDKLRKEIIFQKYGEYKYKEYGEIGLAKTVESKPLKTKMRDYTNTRQIEITEYDVLNSKEYVQRIPTIPACLIS